MGAGQSTEQVSTNEGGLDYTSGLQALESHEGYHILKVSEMRSSCNYHIVYLMQF